MNVTEKYITEKWTECKWGAVYAEMCKYGSGASTRKPIAVMQKGAGYLAYSSRATADRATQWKHLLAAVRRSSV